MGFGTGRGRYQNNYSVLSSSLKSAQVNKSTELPEVVGNPPTSPTAYESVNLKGISTTFDVINSTTSVINYNIQYGYNEKGASLLVNDFTKNLTADNIGKIDEKWIPKTIRNEFKGLKNNEQLKKFKESWTNTFIATGKYIGKYYPQANIKFLSSDEFTLESKGLKKATGKENTPLITYNGNNITKIHIKSAGALFGDKFFGGDKNPITELSGNKNAVKEVLDISSLIYDKDFAGIRVTGDNKDELVIDGSQISNENRFAFTVTKELIMPNDKLKSLVTNMRSAEGTKKIYTDEDIKNSDSILEIRLKLLSNDTNGQGVSAEAVRKVFIDYRNNISQLVKDVTGGKDISFINHEKIKDYDDFKQTKFYEDLKQNLANRLGVKVKDISDNLIGTEITKMTAISCSGKEGEKSNACADFSYIAQLRASDKNIDWSKIGKNAQKIVQMSTDIIRTWVQIRQLDLQRKQISAYNRRSADMKEEMNKNRKIAVANAMKRRKALNL
jgi:hypothetical protein